MKRYIPFILLLGILVSACKTSYVTVSVLKPANITIPSKINKIAFVNRTRPAKQERARNVIEGVITGESVFADRKAAEECLKGVLNRLDGSPRFQAFLPGGLELKGTGTREFPAPLEWWIVEDICKQNQVDALIALEVFDSNNSRSMSERQAERKDGDKVIKYTEYTATLHVNIEAGWRIYYPAEQRIIDQNIFTDGRSWSNSSDSKKRAEEGLIIQDAAISDAGYFAGQQYAGRISPLWINVSRFYYRKGNTDFEAADRRAKTNDWKGAAELWKKHVNSGNPKIAGEACYNMALACEMEGDLQTAIDWAKKSYVNFNNKKARYYSNTLQNRLYDQKRLDEQMRQE